MVSVLRQCAIQEACRLLAYPVYSSSFSSKERVFLEMSFDLETSIQPARPNPHGAHCETSRPDVGLPAAARSAAEGLARRPP